MQGLSEACVSFLNASPTPFHAVAEAKDRLRLSGFEKLNETASSWSLRRGGRYFLSRNGSSLIAFCVGQRWTPEEGAFAIIGAHTDSPTLIVKPMSHLVPSSANSYHQLGVTTYGGGLWHTWFDRDLTLAGRVFAVKSVAAATPAAKEELQEWLIAVKRPLLRIPSLAIHLGHTLYAEGFKINTHTHLTPILQTAIKAQLETVPADAHNADLLALLATEIGLDRSRGREAIRELELFVVDSQPAAIGGLQNEFILSARLDNLAGCFAVIEALRRASTDENLAAETAIRMIVLFDHEEIGSMSERGALSPLLNETIERTVAALIPTTPQVSAAALIQLMVAIKQRSFLISCDMAHAVHPNFADKFDERHRPVFHQGVVLKTHLGRRFGTTRPTALLIKEIARQHTPAPIPIQEFAPRDNLGTGATVGPIAASETGIRTVDIGIVTLAMHSIREMIGTDDLAHLVALMTDFFVEFSQTDARLRLR
jgi:aspartyl aminopeptidase